ncbi:hypothetical protein G7B40_030910 [Aetokthonos hydrillicola Thurmond2011]|jgi:serine/threonine protein phosphatase PrpC|uniref:PPM-type phosphatase domain-containing protein n=1 Tax=Aetokthonos hydrillicola Thurmond2011 TaxID=2712845 RepID=A0AAP5IGP9_9CYAN|nr:hypothetical protein [Aetokthonos hydrillicola]MBW4589681.1 hypothetical protein [Aetokthonos hydrillicola CCALA 1050]MDR9898935.1 hypothetical protein [Aetokthonos hydrillicola Thurmond2011]
MNQAKNNPQVFSIPKHGESTRTNEDSCAIDPYGIRIAIADGMGTTLNPKYWSDAITQHFIQYQRSYKICKFIHDRYDIWLKEPQKMWREWFIQNASTHTARHINFSNGSNGRRDSRATFLGIEFSPVNFSTEVGRWAAVALGDSCLFHIRKDSSSDYHLVESFPVKSSKEFSPHTPGFSSNSDNNGDKPSYCEGQYSLGDIFILGTDALSEWILKSIETNNDEWKELLSVSTDDEFESLIERLRQEKKINDDDTTFCILSANKDVQQYPEWKDDYIADNNQVLNKLLSPTVASPLFDTEEVSQILLIKPALKSSIAKILRIDFNLFFKLTRSIPYTIWSFIKIGIVLIFIIELFPQCLFYWITFVSKVTVTRSYPYFHSIEMEYQHKKSQ